MFYSQTFLARKGPLGTVWCAAHMQNRLKKSHYASTDILSTVDRIMFPEVPLALRMSSHLLLGVVRIYSKQVDILYDDCNSFVTRLRKAFASIDLNLPEDARQAPIQAITLPDTFDLDVMDLDDDLNFDKVDNHLKSLEDITLDDQILEAEPYISITFDVDFMDSSHLAEVPGATAMDQNAVPSTAVQNGEGVADPSIQNDEQETVHSDIAGFEKLDGVSKDLGPSSLIEMRDPRHSNDISPEVIPDIEVMREAVPDISANIPHLPIFGNDMAEPQASSDQLMNEKETITPILETNITPREQAQPFQPISGPHQSMASLQEDLVNNSSVSFAIRATPPVQKPRAGPRKRKQFYDEAPVLTNKFMKKALEDPRDLLRKRNKIPQSSLGRWRLETKFMKEKVFLEPSITGFCSDLRNIFKEDWMSPKLLSAEEAHPDSGVVRSPVPETSAPPTEASPHCHGPELQTPTQDKTHEVEILRHTVSDDEGNTLPEIIPSPGVTPSLRRDISPSPTQTLRSTTPVPMTERDTSTVFSREYTGLEYTGLSDVPELNFEEDDLTFLEADNTPPAASQSLHGVDSLSVRARAVAQYLKRHSPVTPSSDDRSEHLNLNKILRGKTRKICARMFFETLVLKSNDLVDMEQEVPYGDITLALTPALAKAQI